MDKHQNKKLQLYKAQCVILWSKMLSYLFFLVSSGHEMKGCIVGNVGTPKYLLFKHKRLY